MNITKIESTLQDFFSEPLNDGEQRKIVFWVDKDQEFIDEIEQLTIQGVKIQRLNESNQFYLKYLLEEEDVSSPYLIYTNIELDGEDNWLMDTFLYSKKFFADRVSLIINELRIDSSLRSIIKKYEKFFNNKERFRKFQELGIENYSQEIIELGIMSVLCNIKTMDFENVLKMILMESLDDTENKYLSLLERFFDIDVFWLYTKKHYGYEQDLKSLKKLFIHLSISALSHSIKEEYLSTLNDFIAEKNKANALVFIDHWMHHKTHYIQFDEYAEMVEQEIQMQNILHSMPIEEYKQSDIFPYIDKAIIINIANSLIEKLEDYDEYVKLIKLRRAKHYYENYKYIYEALYYTVKMHQFYKKYENGIPSGQVIDIYESYQKEYYVMDTYYRKFYVAYDEENNNELIKKLRDLVENLYVNWFLGELSSQWLQVVKSEMTTQWSIDGLNNQQNFYSSTIAPHIRKGERVFVIISDAMRYEVGAELAERLNSETMGICDMQSMVGVIPSVTKLGMAALLPHTNLDFDSNGKVLLDGKDCSGLENRKKIIHSFVEESTAIHFQDVISMNKLGRRETFKGKKLVYIYHDTIDAMGDKASTEVYTFNAVETALKQLYDLVKIIRDDLSGTNIYITSDHGFLYQRNPLEESDKISNELIGSIEVKRRYALSKNSHEVSGQLLIDLDSIIKNDNQINAYVPNGTIRNRMQGTGVNFVHGGASLQEVVVPLVVYKNKRVGQKGSQLIQKVDIRLTSTARKITNSIFNLEFFQTEKVEDKVISRTVVLYIVDENSNIISNEETIIGDRTSSNPTDRTFRIQFVLKNMTYDRSKSYYLIIKDTETDVVTEKIQFSINLGIISDFDF